MTIPDETLAEWEQVAEAATPGPWVSAFDCPGYCNPKCDDCKIKDQGRNSVADINYKHTSAHVFTQAAVEPYRDSSSVDNASFMALSRSALPDLINAYRELKAENEGLRHQVESWTGFTKDIKRAES